MIDAREIASKLVQATALPDSRVLLDMKSSRNSTVDYYRIACHILFTCERCGTCCIEGNPIKLNSEDIFRIARHLKIPVSKTIKKYTTADPKQPHLRSFKNVLPCRFYNSVEHSCRIYSARPRSCRIFPFLGIYGLENQIKVHESCPGSVRAVEVLKQAIEDVKSDKASSQSLDAESVKKAKEWFKDVLKASFPQ